MCILYTMQVNEAVLYNLIGERLRQQRIQVDMTQTQLAEAVGVLRTSIANIEAGRQKPPLHLLYKLCMELGVEVADILPRNTVIFQPTIVTIEGTPKEDFPKTAELLKELLEE
jgi:DNA-binding XRE family transcriptional regulator